MSSSRDYRYLYGFLLAAAAGMGAVLLFAAYAAWLPHPNHSTRTQLLYWIATRELAQESPELRQALQLRLIEEFREIQDFGPRHQGGFESLEPEMRRRLEANAELLTQEWFDSQVKSYAATRAEHQERQEFVNQTLEIALRWSTFAAELKGSQAPSNDPTERIQSLIAEAPASLRDEAERLVSDAIVIWLSDQEVSQWQSEPREKFAIVIAHELDKHPLQHVAVASWQTPERQARMRRNAQSLLGTWMQLQAVKMQMVPADQQNEFVDQCLAQVSRWNLQEAFLGEIDTDSMFGRMQAMLQFEQQLQAWIAASPSEHQLAVDRFASIVRSRVIHGAMGSIFDAQKESLPAADTEVLPTGEAN